MAYDVVVIGSGPGGYVCAVKCAQLGLKTAIVEKRSTLGGTCLNIGCIPSKALLQASEHFVAAEHTLPKMGVKVGKPKLDLKAMMAHKDATVKSNVDGVAFLMKKNKIDWLTGTGSVLGEGKVAVVGEDGKTTEIETKNIVVLNNPVVHNCNFPGAIRMRVRIEIGRSPVSCPSGVGNTLNYIRVKIVPKKLLEG